MHTFGKTGCIAFLTAFALQVTSTFFVGYYFHNFDVSDKNGTFGRIELPYMVIGSITVFFLCCIVSKISCPEQIFQVVWRSSMLGTTLASGIAISLYCHEKYWSLGWYISIMSFFHFSEFVVTSIIRPKNLSLESFLLNHSKAYAIAAITSWIEYLCELWIFPGLKMVHWISAVGLFLCLGGEIFRKTAMLTAFHNFDHLIRTRREEHHQLVTSGIYSLCRHPSYVGWFYWSIGTQVILCNPLCTIAYTIASWKFFHERVFEEEMTLHHFFGREYEVYQSKVSTGLPFIDGYHF